MVVILLEVGRSIINWKICSVTSSSSVFFCNVIHAEMDTRNHEHSTSSMTMSLINPSLIQIRDFEWSCIMNLFFVRLIEYNGPSVPISAYSSPLSLLFVFILTNERSVTQYIKLLLIASHSRFNCYLAKITFYTYTGCFAWEFKHSPIFFSFVVFLRDKFISKIKVHTTWYIVK